MGMAWLCMPSGNRAGRFSLALRLALVFSLPDETWLDAYGFLSDHNQDHSFLRSRSLDRPALKKWRISGSWNGRCRRCRARIWGSGNLQSMRASVKGIHEDHTEVLWRYGEMTG
jgi:hypothetical protein